MESRNELKQGLSWSIFLGVLIIVLGLVAISKPIFATLAAELFFGWICIFAGAVQLMFAFQTHGVGPFFLKLILAALYGIAGIFLLADPLAGAISLTMILGLFILFESMGQIILAFDLKPIKDWGWVLLSGIIGMVLGILILNQWPFNAPWIIGLLVGINLFFKGLSITLFSSAAREALD